MPVISVDAPVGGLNAYDSVDSMAATDAIILDNWICRSGFVESRPGTTRHTGDLGGRVETLKAYKGTGPAPTGPGPSAAATVESYRLLAGYNGNISDVTDGTTTVIGSGFNSDRWQTQMMNNRLIMVNGQDYEQAYDGEALAPLVYTNTADAWDSGTTYFIGDLVTQDDETWQALAENTNDDPSDGSGVWELYYGRFIGVTSFKGRAIYWKEGALSFFYAEAGSYQGILQEYDLSSILQRGGYIESIYSWTVDSGTGPDDMLVISFNTGEFLLYQGDDPGNIGYFEQVGRFEMPDPLSIRGQMKYGSDVVVMTINGYVNLSTVLKEEAVTDYPAFSRKIARLVFDGGNLYRQYYGHECIQTDTGFLLFNVPTGEDSAYQLVQNPSTGAWSRVTGWDAITFEVFDNDLYFGGMDGYVYKVGGTTDSGLPIPLDALPAYNYLGDPGVNKQITAVQVLSTFPAPKLISVTGFADFDIPKLNNASVAPGATGGTAWNTTQWDTSQWNRDGGVIAKTTKGWQNVHAFGYAVTVAVQMKIQSQNVIWRQTGYRYRTAGAQ